MCMLVGQKAPVFKAKAVIDGNKIVENYSLEEFLGKKYVVFFFYPADFTFVCPTELIAFQEKLTEFKERDTEVVACSTDSEYSHWKWLQIDKKDGGIKGVTYPLVSDSSNSISENYGVLAGHYEYSDDGRAYFLGEAKAYRGLFLIDKQGIVRHQTINDMPIGRSVDEVLRVIDALQFFEANGEVCPANWHKGDKALKPTQEGISEYLSSK